MLSRPQHWNLFNIYLCFSFFKIINCLSLLSSSHLLICPCSQTRNFLLWICFVMMSLMPLQKSVQPVKIMFLFHLKVYIAFHLFWFPSRFILDLYDYCYMLINNIYGYFLFNFGGKKRWWLNFLSCEHNNGSKKLMIMVKFVIFKCSNETNFFNVSSFLRNLIS